MSPTFAAIGLAFSALAAIAAGTAAGRDLAPGVSQLFGDRVEAAAGAKTPLAQGDLDGDGKPDQVFLVSLASGAGKSVAADVQIIGALFGGHALGAAGGGHGLAIALNGGAKKFLVVDVQAPLSGGFFETPIWTDAAAHWDKTHESPLAIKKRGSADLKGFPCLAKSGKGDVALLGTEAGIAIALAWTGATFKTCEEPGAEP